VTLDRCRTAILFYFLFLSRSPCKFVTFDSAKPPALYVDESQGDPSSPTPPPLPPLPPSPPFSLCLCLSSCLSLSLTLSLTLSHSLSLSDSLSLALTHTLTLSLSLSLSLSHFLPAFSRVSAGGGAEEEAKEGLFKTNTEN
jgi:hypothetical protein